MSTLGTMLDALVTALQAANGAGSYTYDLSAADRVKVGWSDAIAPLPQVQLLPVIRGDSEFGRTHGHYLRRPVVAFVGYVAANKSTEYARVQAGTNLLGDIMRALEASRVVGGTEDIVVRNWEILGAELERDASVAVVLGEIHLQYKVGAGL